MLGECLRKSAASPSKNARNPGVLVRPVPDGYADAFLDFVAGSDRRGVVLSLLLLVLVGLWFIRADVELGDGDFEAQVCEGFHVGYLILERWSRADDEVVLKANAIDLDAVGLNELDDVLSCGGFRAGGFDGAKILLARWCVLFHQR